LLINESSQLRQLAFVSFYGRQRTSANRRRQETMHV
jgi:hypothetical protein